MVQEEKEKLEALVVDDEPIVGKNLKIILKKLDLNIESYEDPAQALERIDNKHFDIVITDVVMGEVDGIQVLEHTTEKHPAAKVIIITAFAQMSLARKAMERGAFDFLAKPFDAEQVRTVVGKAIDALQAESA